MLASMDQNFFYFLFNLSLETPFIGSLMVVITNWSSKIFVAIYVVTFLILLLKRNTLAIPFFTAPALCFGLVHLIRLVYLRPRPFVALEIESLIYHSTSGSFPSMHSVSAFVIATCIYFIDKTAGKIILLLAMVTGLSRVMVGVHYPLDIIIGAALSVSLSFLIFKGYQKYTNKPYTSNLKS